MRRAIIIAIVVGMLLTNIMPWPVHAAGQGDGLFMYGQGTVTTPRYRTWTASGSTMSAELSSVAAGSTIRHVIIQPSPMRNEFIAGIQTTAGMLYIQRWNGSTWSNEWSVSVGNSSMPRFDIEYEALSGQALVVYTGNVATVNEMRYRVWNGSSWVGPSNYDPARTSGIVDAIALVRQPSSDKIGMAWGDTNFDLSADVWDGASNTFTSEPSAALSTDLARVGAATAITNFSFDLAFESVSGDLMVTWGNNAVLDLKHVIRTAAGSWGSVVTTTAFAEEPTDIELSAEPASDYIAYANATDNGADAEAAIWNGGSWTPISNFDTGIDTVATGTKNIAVTWLVKSGTSRAVVTYDDNNASGVDWLFYNKTTNTWSGLQTDFTTAPAPNATNDFMHRLEANPYAPNEAILTVIDGGRDVFAKRIVFDGTNLTWSSIEAGGVAMETTVSSTSGLAAAYKYYRYAPGTLTADIIDANENSVVSPSVAFPVSTVSFSCQSRSATLGSSAQVIRVDNGTANNLWTLSIAATAGANATWSDGVSGYDFNDGGGVPSGCADSGGDADGAGGQLTVDPSTSTITSMLDCTSTGVSKGSVAAFSQGVTDAVTLVSAGATAQASCFFDITNIGLGQNIPPETPSGTYTLNMTVTVVAN